LVEELIQEFRLAGVTIKHISADSGVVSQSEFQVLTPNCERKLRSMRITTEQTEPYNHERGSSHVERVMIRTIKELINMAMTYFLRNPNLPALGFTKIQVLKLWGEIFNWAVTINNLKSCRNGEGKNKI
jgi:hypothetical protein